LLTQSRRPGTHTDPESSLGTQPGKASGEEFTGPGINLGLILATIPYAMVHLACFAVFWTGVSVDAVLVCFLAYLVRMFGVTAGYHRYFAHRAFKTSRVFQFFLALLATSSAQLGPLWWAATHRHHHSSSDTVHDPHNAIRDYAKFPELVFVDKWSLIAPTILAFSTYGLGYILQQQGRPTTPMQMLIWGFFVSTVLLYHGTYTINSLSHLFGSQRFVTGDDSRNNPLLAIITLGEGWHNNHHHYQSSCRQGFYWWEIDFTFMTLFLLSRLGLVWDLRPVPDSIYAEAKARKLS
jgi:stearoyl-CoA desaturase (delta-9 desaturase)